MIPPSGNLLGEGWQEGAQPVTNIRQTQHSNIAYRWLTQSWAGSQVERKERRPRGRGSQVWAAPRNHRRWVWATENRPQFQTWTPPPSQVGPFMAHVAAMPATTPQ